MCSGRFLCVYVQRPPPSKVGVATVVFVLMTLAALHMRADSPPPPPVGPGAMQDGSTMLPNGWRLSPAGKHLKVGDLPLNVVQTPDSRYR